MLPVTGLRHNRYLDSGFMTFLGWMLDDSRFQPGFLEKRSSGAGGECRHPLGCFTMECSCALSPRSSFIPLAAFKELSAFRATSRFPHRYAMLAAIAEGTSRFHNFSAARDCGSTLGCVAELGAKWSRAETDGAIEVTGTGMCLTAPTRLLDCGNSGSTMRMLSGILAGQPFVSELFGDESLSRRPMARIMKPLSEMGARISAADGGRPPLKIEGGPLRAIHYKPEVASAQVKSCVLFAGLFAEGETVVEEPIRTRDHGEIALRAFGAEVERTGNKVSIRGGQRLSGN